MKRKKRIIVLLLMSLLLGISGKTVRAAEETGTDKAQEEENIEAADIGMYLIPCGSEGKETGQFWFYAEVLDSDGQAFRSSSWTVDLEITGRGEDQAELQEAPDGVGYINEEVALISESGYKEFELYVRVKDQDTVILEKREYADMCILDWPSLKSNTWEKNVKWTERKKDITRSIVFDWKDQDLFSRLFSVEIEKKPKDIDFQFQESKQIWVMQVKSTVQNTIEITLSDMAGNTQKLSYQVDVKIETIDWIYVFIIFLIIAVAVILGCQMWKRSHSGETDEEDEIVSEGEDESLRENLRVLEETKEALDQTIDKLVKRREFYRNIWSRNQELFQKSGKGQMDAQMADGKRPRFTEEEKAYEEAVKALEGYLKNYKIYEEEWKKPETKQRIDQIMRDLGDARKSVETEIGKVNGKISELEQLLRVIQIRKEQLERPLNMHLAIEITIGKEEYRISQDGQESGFSFDDMVPLNRQYHFVEKNMRQLLGEETGICISAKSKNEIVLECPNGNLSENGNRVTYRKIPKGFGAAFVYKRQKTEDTVTIKIRTR